MKNDKDNSTPREYTLYDDYFLSKTQKTVEKETPEKESGDNEIQKVIIPRKRLQQNATPSEETQKKPIMKPARVFEEKPFPDMEDEFSEKHQMKPVRLTAKRTVEKEKADDISVTKPVRGKTLSQNISFEDDQEPLVTPEINVTEPEQKETEEVKAAQVMPEPQITEQPIKFVNVTKPAEVKKTEPEIKIDETNDSLTVNNVTIPALSRKPKKVIKSTSVTKDLNNRMKTLNISDFINSEEFSDPKPAISPEKQAADDFGAPTTGVKDDLMKVLGLAAGAHEDTTEIEIVEKNDTKDETDIEENTETQNEKAETPFNEYRAIAETIADAEDVIAIEDTPESKETEPDRTEEKEEGTLSENGNKKTDHISDYEQLYELIGKDNVADDKTLSEIFPDEAPNNLKRRTNRRYSTENEVLPIMSVIYDWLEVFALSAAFVLVIFTFFMRLAVVDGNSMNNTLHDGDMLIISDLAYTPEYKDIVVIDLPTRQVPIIKRVIATEGQTVDIDFDTWTVTVDGVVLEEDYINRVSGTMHKSDISFPLTVPKGKVFVMGDNRNDSLDSRSSTIGLIDERFILGSVKLRLSPINQFGKVD